MKKQKLHKYGETVILQGVELGHTNSMISKAPYDNASGHTMEPKHYICNVIIERESENELIISTAVNALISKHKIQVDNNNSWLYRNEYYDKRNSYNIKVKADIPFVVVDKKFNFLYTKEVEVEGSEGQYNIVQDVDKVPLMGSKVDIPVRTSLMYSKGKYYVSFWGLDVIVVEEAKDLRQKSREELLKRYNS